MNELSRAFDVLHDVTDRGFALKYRLICQRAQGTGASVSVVLTTDAGASSRKKGFKASDLPGLTLRISRERGVQLLSACCWSILKPTSNKFIKCPTCNSRYISSNVALIGIVDAHSQFRAPRGPAGRHKILPLLRFVEAHLQELKVNVLEAALMADSLTELIAAVHEALEIEYENGKLKELNERRLEGWRKSEAQAVTILENFFGRVEARMEAEGAAPDMWRATAEAIMAEESVTAPPKLDKPLR